MAQTRKPDEIILVDAYSTDRTVEIAKQYPVKIFYDKRDLGTARDLGWKKAKGDIVVFTDVDAYPDKHWLEEIERAFSEHPEIGGVQGRSVIIGNEKLSERFHRRALKAKYFTFTHGANMAFRRKVLEEVGGFDSNKNCGWEDMDIGYRVSRKYKILYVPTAIVYEVKKGEERTERTIKRNVKYWFLFAKKHRRYDLLIRPIFYAFYSVSQGKIREGMLQFVEFFKNLPMLLCGSKRDEG